MIAWHGLETSRQTPVLGPLLLAAGLLCTGLGLGLARVHWSQRARTRLTRAKYLSSLQPGPPAPFLFTVEERGERDPGRDIACFPGPGAECTERRRTAPVSLQRTARLALISAALSRPPPSTSLSWPVPAPAPAPATVVPAPPGPGLQLAGTRRASYHGDSLEVGEGRGGQRSRSGSADCGNPVEIK